MRVFISYRREDSSPYARDLHRELTAKLPAGQVFWDIKAIELGQDFKAAIDRAVGSCDALIALIGPRWVTTQDEERRQRLGKPDDFVRLEIAGALERKVRVFPILVGGASMPKDKDLPEPLKKLCYLNASLLRDSDWDYDIQRLVEALCRVDSSPTESPASPPNNLPAQVSPLIGRAREVGTVCGLLTNNDVRLVTLSGTGGTGKTRVALAVAARLLATYRGGVYFVALASITDASLVAPTIANVLGIAQSDTRPVLDSLKLFLRDRQLLLVLDNFEQVAAGGPLLAELLETCPGLRVLVTSRVVLRISAEHNLHIPPLGLPDPHRQVPAAELIQYEAVRLFVDRARALKQDFELSSENSQAVAEICARLEGLPLAIELAAARVRVLPPAALLRRLHSRLETLTGGAQDLPLRQQTLRGAIAWSYELLQQNQRALFRRMALFSGGCTIEAVDAVCRHGVDDGIDVLEGLTALTDASLLQVVSADAGEPRFVMLETIREFAAEQLQELRESTALRSVHMTYFMTLAEETALLLPTGQMLRALRVFRQEQENLWAALEWAGTADPDAAQRLKRALMKFRKQQTYLLPL